MNEKETKLSKEHRELLLACGFNPEEWECKCSSKDQLHVVKRKESKNGIRI